MSSRSDLQQRLAFLNLEAGDRDLLTGLRPALEKHADALVAAFYRHLLSFAPTREVLADPAVKERLLVKQREYLLSLADPALDDAYVAERRHIGEIHKRIGLEPRWYLGAYSLYFSLLVPIICDANAQDPERGARTTVALQKLLTFDIQLALEAYIESSESELRYATRELAEQSRRLAREFDDQSATLRRTKHEARAAEELAAVGTLVAGLAHEIGTPMGVIQGHAKLLESAISGDDARWRLTTIQQQISRISRIIETLLNIARPRRMSRSPLALEPLLDTALSFLSEKLSHRTIEVERSYAPVPSVLADAERIQQLCLNLFLNAADAMPDGGTLGVALCETPEHEAEIRISDTGSGISENDLERVFEPFFTTKPAGEGSGLGLMVCKGIVTDHGGTIDVTSREGQGTEFRILLPIAR